MSLPSSGNKDAPPAVCLVSAVLSSVANVGINSLLKM
jgi:hypothetical protein